MANITVRTIDCHIMMWDKNIPKYLLLKRSDNKLYPDVWQCVTGKIKKNEKSYKAALRELNEETGLRAKKMWVIDRVNFFFESQENRMNIIPVFGVEINFQPIVLSSEHKDYKWCNINSAIRLLLWNQQKEGLRSFHDMLIKKSKKLEFSRVII
tara:strand:- start:339 stop:800 length:462 start_codon:yes stop_codon:yes gene_type:complete